MVGEAGLGRPSSIGCRRQAVAHFFGKLLGARVLEFKPGVASKYKSITL
jgi:hypothetical protein